MLTAFGKGDMKRIRLITCIFILIGTFSCQAQNNKKMETTNNPLLCEPEKGICEIPVAQASAHDYKITIPKKPVKIIYYTDPICSSCWGIEPQLRKLKLEYGNDIEIEYHMGGLLPDWSYNSGGISKPSDVAHHWDQVSRHYQMPIDGDVWLEDPLHSSYPPSIAFKAAQIQDEHKAVKFLRALREMLFLEKKNITKWTYVEKAAIKTGLDPVKLKQDYEGKARDFFQEDLNLARKLGVRGFPTLFITDNLGNQELIYGFNTYETFENGVKKIHPKARKTEYKKDWKSLFENYPTLTTREFAELNESSFRQSEKALENLFQQNELTKLTTKNGTLWIRKNIHN